MIRLVSWSGVRLCARLRRTSFLGARLHSCCQSPRLSSNRRSSCNTRIGRRRVCTCGSPAWWSIRDNKAWLQRSPRRRWVRMAGLVAAGARNSHHYKQCFKQPERDWNNFMKMPSAVIISAVSGLSLFSLALAQQRAPERPAQYAARGTHGAIAAGSGYATDAAMRMYYPGRQCSGCRRGQHLRRRDH